MTHDLIMIARLDRWLWAGWAKEAEQRIYEQMDREEEMHRIMSARQSWSRLDEWQLDERARVADEQAQRDRLRAWVTDQIGPNMPVKSWMEDDAW